MVRKKNRNVLLRNVVLLLIITALTVSLAGCGKKPSSYEVADAYFKDLQKDASAFVRAVKLNQPYSDIIKEMIQEIEYELLEDEAHELGAHGLFGVELVGIKVQVKGYDLGSYFQTYLDSVATEGIAILRQKYSLEELTSMYSNDPERYEELFMEASISYFKEVMDHCRAAGKTYSVTTALPMFYNKDTEEWDIDPLHVDYMFDAISNRLLTIIKEERNKTDN